VTDIIFIKMTDKIKGNRSGVAKVTKLVGQNSRFFSIYMGQNF
jgi:hypothetical protein